MRRSRDACAGLSVLASPPRWAVDFDHDGIIVRASLKKRQAMASGNRSGQMILGNGPSVRKDARRKYEQVKRKLDRARLEITRFKTEDHPAFGAWLHRHFGPALGEMRELSRQYEDKARLLREVDAIAFREGVSIGVAYRLAQHRREHPDEPPPPPQNHAREGADLGQKFADEDIPTDEDEAGQEGYAEFAQAFADIFGTELPPGFQLPGMARRTMKNSRVKELYRILARKLHPDAQEQMTAEKLEWWHEVQEAYARGDAERLEMILNLCEMADGSSASHTSVSMLQRITAQFGVTLRALKQVLRGYRRDPAWNFSKDTGHNVIEQRIRAEMEEERERLLMMTAEVENLLRECSRLAASPSRTRRPRRASGRSRPFQEEQSWF